MLDQHLEWMAARGLRDRTIERRGQCLRRFRATIHEPIETAAESTLIAWYAALPLRGHARASELSNVGQFYRWLVLYDHRPDDPTRKLIAPKLVAGRPRPISEDALALALAFACERVRPWLFLAGYCGLRCGEIARLAGEDRTGDMLRIDGKGGKVRLVPVHPLVDAHVRFCPGRLFTMESGPISPHCVSQAGNRELHKLGISETMHQLRHRFGTRLYQLTRDLRLVQEVMGHADPATTAVYAEPDMASLGAMIAAI